MASSQYGVESVITAKQSVLSQLHSDPKGTHTISLMKKCSQLKTKAKLLFKNIDTAKTGLVAEELFHDILKLLAISLSAADLKAIKGKFSQSVKGQRQLNYK